MYLNYWRLLKANAFTFVVRLRMSLIFLGFRIFIPILIYLSIYLSLSFPKKKQNYFFLIPASC